MYCFLIKGHLVCTTNEFSKNGDFLVNELLSALSSSDIKHPLATLFYGIEEILSYGSQNIGCPHVPSVVWERNTWCDIWDILWRGGGEKGVPNARNTIHRKKSPPTRIVSFPRIAGDKSNLKNSLNWIMTHFLGSRLDFCWHCSSL